MWRALCVRVLMTVVAACGQSCVSGMWARGRAADRDADASGTVYRCGLSGCFARGISVSFNEHVCHFAADVSQRTTIRVHMANRLRRHRGSAKYEPDPLRTLAAYHFDFSHSHTGEPASSSRSRSPLASARQDKGQTRHPRPRTRHPCPPPQRRSSRATHQRAPRHTTEGPHAGTRVMSCHARLHARLVGAAGRSDP